MDCLIAPGKPMRNGYHRVKRKGVTTMAHRQAWEDAFGPIPAGREIHHTCENPACINLSHLRCLTKAEHGLTRRKTHCKHGHLLSTSPRGKRVCAECSRRHCREYYAKKVAA